MRKGRAHTVALSITVILAVMCTAESCDQKKVKKQFRKWNYKVGKATVACNDAWDKIYKDVAEKHTEDIIKEYGDDPNFTDEMAENEFKERMKDVDKHNDRFEDSMKIIANSLEAIEQSLDAADHIDQELWKAMIKDVLNALGNVEEILTKFAADTENETFMSAMNWIGVAINGANQLLEAFGGYEPDPEDPKQD